MSFLIFVLNNLLNEPNKIWIHIIWVLKHYFSSIIYFLTVIKLRKKKEIILLLISCTTPPKKQSKKQLCLYYFITSLSLSYYCCIWFRNCTVQLILNRTRAITVILKVAQFELIKFFKLLTYIALVDYSSLAFVNLIY